MASKNFFALLDSDDEDVPKQVVKREEKKEAVKPVKKVEDKKSNNKQARGANSNNKAGRGGRGGTRRRDHDRRSGTGRGRETAKHGGGAHNWGNESDKNELVAEAAAQEGVKSPSDEEANEEVEAVVEEEDNQMTLDEYMAKQKENRAGEKFAETEVRQITNEFSNSAQITKENKTPDFIEAQYERVFSKKTSGRKKNIVTDVGFRAPPTERRSYNNRDGDNNSRGRGRGGRFNSRRGRGSNAPNVSNLADFPTLG